jgi:UDPglucose 6-dehydrogenase/GDP-mannose 6-dehydrogenase
MKGVHLMKELRVGEKLAPITNFLMAGCGFGGSCFPKDVKALVAQAKTDNVPTPLLQAVLDINAKQPHKLIELLEEEPFANLKGVRVAVLGLAFKPGTDDMRESPAIPIVNELVAQGANVKAFDPIAASEARRVFANLLTPRITPDDIRQLPLEDRIAQEMLKAGGESLEICASLNECIDNVHAILLVTRWPEFAQLPDLLRRMSRPPLLVDGRRMIEPGSVPRYRGIGL